MRVIINYLSKWCSPSQKIMLFNTFLRYIYFASLQKVNKDVHNKNIFNKDNPEMP
jgi:transposase